MIHFKISYNLTNNLTYNWQSNHKIIHFREPPKDGDPARIPFGLAADLRFGLALPVVDKGFATQTWSVKV